MSPLLLRLNVNVPFVVDVMKRRLFNLLTALSLLGFVLVCALAVRSYFACDSVQWEHYPDSDDIGRAAVEGWLTGAGAESSNGRCEVWWSVMQRPTDVGEVIIDRLTPAD